MNLGMAFSMAMKSVRANKGRSFLTMLGIIIGVCSVIILVSIVNGATADIKSQVESMGTNLINVTVMPRGTTRRVEMSDMEEMVEKNAEYIDAVSPIVSGQVTVKYGNSSIVSTLTGTNEYYKSIRNTSVQSGRFISELDVIKRQKVAVIGMYQVNELFDGVSPVNEKIKLNGELYTVIGVLEEKANGKEGTDDDKIMIPYTAAMRLVRNATITSYAVSAADSETVDMAEIIIENFLFNILENEDAYMVLSQATIIDVMDEMLGILSTMLGGIAGISLLVGGIGIMNIMIVSVTERTREIGIRKSIGAQKRSILIQFLIESMVLSCMGGVIGIIVGIFGAQLVGKALGITAVTSFGVILLSFGFSAAVGVFFGWYPANKAAKLNPIEALRHE